MPQALSFISWSAVKPALQALWQRLRHPRRRDILIALATPPALLLAWVLLLIPFTPGISDICKAREEAPTQVLTADGKALAEFKRGNRDWVALDAISPRVIEALIATEDRRFYAHHGIDFRRLAGATLATLKGDTQGGSTITQQLARNLFPDEIGRKQNLTRKLKEAITALKIEAVYSKQQILETYLNTVPFLFNAYGIDMAARTYFGKPAKALDLLESATLIGMLKGTSYYNPVLNPERARERRNLVLSLMARQDKLSTARYEALAQRPLKLDFERQRAEPGPASHFVMHLKRWLIDWADRNDYDIYTDGLVVRTTIDARLQTYATRAVEQRGSALQGVADGAWAGQWRAGNRVVEALVRDSKAFADAQAGGESEAAALKRLLADAAFMRALRAEKTRIEAGFMAIDPRTGAILAWVGSRDYAEDAFDHVRQARRQPGSTFKPFVYGAAFEDGAKPDDTLLDTPVEIPLPGGEVWRPDDAAPPTGEPMRLATALALSRNRITAQLVHELGAARVARLARAMGVRDSKLEEVPSLALGTSPVTLYEMVSAYATIANAGHYIAPAMVLRIENRKGEVLEEFHPADAQRAISAEAEDMLLDAMRGVIDRGTGSAIRNRFGVRGDLAGKTGTTQDNTDGWFILMHPQLVGGAWVGFNDARITLRSDYWGQGARSALPIVGDVFSRAQGARLISSSARFPKAQDATLGGRIKAWYESMFGTEPQAEASAPRPRPSAPPPAQSDADAVEPAGPESGLPAAEVSPVEAPAADASAPTPPAEASAPATPDVPPPPAAQSPPPG
ncbi:transglycosylase domain-containing protein [Niveibacterium sp. 24ML]|uniref:penicillin-binding protein 1A n=1 Tax=Niveibacterium sp. 24ML TaxID=2985512 RepID=UPI00226E3AF5|nr:transglycosylase domain-containing protein [Niveibacterium sp. 24ML]MCX9155757.1 transglycosylase domain-containing protein [Niveibacterium sp. 24ML]